MCASVGGSIVKPQSRAEADYISHAAKQSVWVAVHNSSRFSDGSLISGITWDSYRAINDQCVVLNTNTQLFILDCEERRIAFCEVLPIVSTTQNPIVQTVESLPDVDDRLNFKELISNFSRPVSDSYRERIENTERRIEQLSNLLLNRPVASEGMNPNINSNLEYLNETVSSLQRNQGTIIEAIADIRSLLTNLMNSVHGENQN